MFDKKSDNPSKKPKLRIVTMDSSDEEKEITLMEPFTESSEKKPKSMEKMRTTWKQLADGEELSVKGLTTSEKEMELGKKSEKEISKNVSNGPESQKTDLPIVTKDKDNGPTEPFTEQSSKKPKSMEKMRTTWRQLSDGDELSVKGLTTSEGTYVKSISSQGGSTKDDPKISKKIKVINEHLKILNAISQENIENKMKMKHTITKECIIELFSGKINKCQEIKKYAKNEQLDLKKIDKVNKNFDDKLQFYVELYDSIISLAQEIANNAPSKYPSDFFNKFNNMINQTLEYLGKFISDHKVFSDKLLKMAYNLLYLYNVLMKRHVFASESITRLDKLYDHLLKE
ncbi:MAG: hypothetical protein QW303_08030, partial [Nitrososphaerota archaeon]